MEIIELLGHIDSGRLALPKFQRGYVWNRKQVRDFMSSLYHGYPVGGILVWSAEGANVSVRGNPAQGSPADLILDGQQRLTTLYGVIKGHPPEFFEGDKRSFTGLWFHLKTKEFEFHSRAKMESDPYWIDLTSLMREKYGAIGGIVDRLPEKGQEFNNALNQLLNILHRKLHVDTIKGADTTVDVVSEIFNRINSGGTKLSKGDLALAKICTKLPEARDIMREKLGEWERSGYSFTLDWLLRSANTILEMEAKFTQVGNWRPDRIKDGIARASKAVDSLLNMVSGRLGLEHDRVLFGKGAFPVMAAYLDRKGGRLDSRDRDKLLYWYVNSAMWGRFSGSIETVMDRDLGVLRDSGDSLDELVKELERSRGDLLVRPDNFSGDTRGVRFYTVLYMLTRMGGARDLGTGMPLRLGHLGKPWQLQVHHIFPKSRLRGKYATKLINQIGNYCFLTQDSNLRISNRLPEEYLAGIESSHPGALESQWIPVDRELWKVERYLDFLEERRRLLAEEANLRLKGLLEGEPGWDAPKPGSRESPPAAPKPSGVGEASGLLELSGWMLSQGLDPGLARHGIVNPYGEETVVDLAWPAGVGEGHDSKVAVLLEPTPEDLVFASAEGFRCFTSADKFKRHVEQEILGRGPSP